MSMDGLVLDIARFFKAARHLWGRCPHCGEPFRMSDAAISSSPEPPRDWLRKAERQRANWEEQAACQQTDLEEEKARLETMSEALASKEYDLAESERELRRRERNLERDAKSRALEMLKTDAALNARIRDARQAAIRQSRSVLLGKMLECIAPCFRRFGHDPRDMRAICNPVDYVVFDGLTMDRAVQEVTFVEVKCGTSSLSSAQRSIRDAVNRRRVRWEQWTVGDPRIPITRQLAPANQKQLPPVSE